MIVVLTPVYAAVLALLFLLLSAYAIVLRRRHAVALGDGDVGALQAAIRSHANFAEYVPLALLLMFFLELAIVLAAVSVRGSSSASTQGVVRGLALSMRMSSVVSVMV